MEGTYTMTCKNCDYFNANEASPDVGACRRYPPQLIYLEEYGEYHPAFPNVLQDSRCGEFTPKFIARH